MKLSHLATTAAAFALMSGVAYAQDPADKDKMPPVEASASTETSSEVNTAPADTTTSSTMSTDTTSSTMPTGTTSPVASSATSFGTGVSVTTTTLTNGPVPDTAENRAKYGQPMSRAGKRTSARGN